MRPYLRPAPTHLVGILAGLIALPSLGANLRGTGNSVRIATDGSSGSQEVATACLAAVRAVQARGWQTPPMVVRVVRTPFDATTPASDLALSADEPLADAYFRTVETLVRLGLSRVAPVHQGEEVARLVAAHLSPRGSELRQAWQRQWVAALARGQLVETALLETAWRLGGDAMVRTVAARPWPDGLISGLREHLNGDPTEVVAEVVLAGLLNPQALGFEVEAPALLAPGEGRTAHMLATSVAPGVYFFPLPVRAAAEGVSLLRSWGVASHAVVRYPLTGQYDVLRLIEGEEVAVPLRGVAWAGVVVTSLDHGGRLSLTSRPLPDYPVVLERWDFSAGDGAVTIAWETKSHSDVLSFVVEGLAPARDGGWRVLCREFVPAAEDGSHPFSYSFVGPGGEGVQLYRLSALTSRGLLAEVGTFPLLTP
jgi:hypothetical protein